MLSGRLNKFVKLNRSSKFNKVCCLLLFRTASLSRRHRNVLVRVHENIAVWVKISAQLRFRGPLLLWFQ